jgi:hypothetical protein
MSVKTKHPDYARMLDKWERCRHVTEGEDSVHKHGERYLPKLHDQTPSEYSAYVMRATFYNATWRTIAGLVGMVFRKPPVVTVPKEVEPMLEDVTMSGVPFHMFAQEVLEEALKLGRLGVLVDYPQVELAGKTLKDAQTLNLRPTMCMYRAENVINWRMDRVNNVWQLVQVVLQETEMVQVDEFEYKPEFRYRVLDLDGGSKYRVRMYEVREQAPVASGQSAAPAQDVLLSTAYPLLNNKNLDFIPFTFLSADDNSQDIDEPPLIDLVNLNLSHYRTMADLEHGAHFTGLPTAWIAGFKPENPNEKLYIGSATAWTFPDPQAKAEYLEFKGEGLKALSSLAEAKEKQMAVLGARMLEQQKRASEAFDSIQAHRKGEESMLAAAAQSVGLGLERVLKWFTDWAGADSKGENVECQLSREFYPQAMTDKMLTALVAAWQSNAISYETLFDNLQAGDVIDADKTVEDEQTLMKNEAPKLSGQTVDPVTGLPSPVKPLNAPRAKTPAAPGSPRGSQPKKNLAAPKGVTRTASQQ